MNENDPEALYQNPLITRYASREMARLFSARRRAETWRQLWIDLAESERELGLSISAAQIAELKKNRDRIDFADIARREKETRHDVMANVHAYGAVAPSAAPIIHLGATSCYVTDNGDLIIMREALRVLAAKTALVIRRLLDFAKKYRALPTLGFTHFQPAQPTTVGKRATLWAQDFLLDFNEITRLADNLPLRGAVGTTGTQASFMELFNGDETKCKKLNALILRRCGFKQMLAVSGQTYTRKLDSQILAALAGLAETAHKFAGDLRLLAHRKELEEPFEKKQIGSSAMAYKRNPMRSERVCSLARFLMNLPANAYATHATQWLERTLDDSANRRLTLPQAFLSADAILELSANIASGVVVYPKIIARNLMAELPFMMTENILMAAVKAGGDRQELHEKIREHSQAAAARVKQEGLDNDLLSRLQNDAAFAKIAKNFAALSDPRLYIGRAPSQVDDFIKSTAPVIRKYLQKNSGAGESIVV
jgi:adenylosuccinate lyase